MLHVTWGLTKHYGDFPAGTSTGKGSLIKGMSVHGSTFKNFLLFRWQTFLSLDSIRLNPVPPLPVLGCFFKTLSPFCLNITGEVFKDTNNSSASNSHQLSKGDDHEIALCTEKLIPAYTALLGYPYGLLLLTSNPHGARVPSCWQGWHSGKR